MNYNAYEKASPLTAMQKARSTGGPSAATETMNEWAL